MIIKQKTGLRPIGSRRIRSFDVGQARRAAGEAVAGDELRNELIASLRNDGLDQFSAALYARGLEFGEITTVGPEAIDGQSWVIYPIGNPEFEPR